MKKNKEKEDFLQLKLMHETQEKLMDHLFDKVNDIQLLNRNDKANMLSQIAIKILANLAYNFKMDKQDLESFQKANNKLFFKTLEIIEKANNNSK